MHLSTETIVQYRRRLYSASRTNHYNLSTVHQRIINPATSSIDWQGISTFRLIRTVTASRTYLTLFPHTIVLSKPLIPLTTARSLSRISAKRKGQSASQILQLETTGYRFHFRLGKCRHSCAALYLLRHFWRSEQDSVFSDK